MHNPKRAKRRISMLEGVCSECGHHVHMRLSEWKAARNHDTWPNCKNCAGRIYPVTRKCSSCSASLRSGNLGKHCALCERNGLGSPVNPDDAVSETASR